MLERLVHPENAESSILVTLSGISMLERFVHPENVSSLFPLHYPE